MLTLRDIQSPSRPRDLDNSASNKLTQKIEEIWNFTALTKQKYKKIPPPVGLEPTTFELEVQHANPLRHGGGTHVISNFKISYLNVFDFVL